MSNEKTEVSAAVPEHESQQESEQFLIRKEKLEALKAEGNNPYDNFIFEQSAYSEDVKEKFAGLKDEEHSGEYFSLAGRMMSKRVMGRASFANIRDFKGDIQLYLKRDDLGEEAYAAFKKLDIGDIIGVSGEVFRTKTGELSIRVLEYTLLTKGLRPLPEKFHGLTDTELRYRQRYVDLIMNLEVKATFIKRSRIISAIREYMDASGFLEVETPILMPFETGAAARPFHTHHNTLGMDMVLRIESELHLKRLLVGGIDRVYEIGRIFRNEGMSPRHNPEFTSIEIYQAYTDYFGMMEIVEGLVKFVADKVCGTRKISHQGVEIDLDNWTRMTMREAVKKYSGADYDSWASDEDAVSAANAAGVDLPEIKTKGKILLAFFDKFVEEKLVQPTFIYEYPVDDSPLAKRYPDNPKFTQRFEFFINGMELGNAFSELNDPAEQRERFERQVEERRLLDPGSKAQVDYDYVNALEYGLPPAGGLGIGIDRLVMILTDNSSVREVLLFPTMRPLEGQGSEVAEDAESVAPEAPALKIDLSKVEIEPLFEDFVDFETFSRSDFRVVKVLECEAVPKSKKLLKFTLDDGSPESRIILSGIREYYEPEELVGKTAIAITNLPPRKMMGIDSCGMLISAVHHEDGEESLTLLTVDERIPAGAKLY